MGVERTQRRDAAKVEFNPFQTSAARFALTQTDVPKCDSLNAPGVWQERKPTTLGCHPCSRSIVLPIWFELMWGA